MLITLRERLNFSQLLPRQGTLEEAIVIEDIQLKIKITQEEIALAKLKTMQTPQGQVFTFEEENAPDKEIEFTELETKLLQDSFKSLSEKRKFPVEYLNLYRKFNLEA